MNLKDPRLRFLIATMAIALVGTAAFAVGRYVLAEDTPTSAQIGPSDTADPLATPDLTQFPPHPNIAARDEAIREDNAKPLFTGTLNGITFIGERTPIPEPESACPPENARALGPESTLPAVHGTSMDFAVNHLPGGLTLDRELATLCAEEVIHIGRIYLPESQDDGRRIAIVRYKSEPFFPAPAPEDRMLPATISDRNAVVVRSIFGNDRTTIIMYDEEDMWILTFDNIDEDDAVKIAEGVR